MRRFGGGPGGPGDPGTGTELRHSSRGIGSEVPFILFYFLTSGRACAERRDQRSETGSGLGRTIYPRLPGSPPSPERLRVACRARAVESVKGKSWHPKSNDVAARGPSSLGTFCRRAHNNYTSGDSDGNWVPIDGERRVKMRLLVEWRGRGYLERCGVKNQEFS